MDEVKIIGIQSGRSVASPGGGAGTNWSPVEPTAAWEGWPKVPDHRILFQIGRGGGGTVWLAQTVLGTFRAIKLVNRDRFPDQATYELEFAGLKAFESVCHRHPEFLQIFHVGRSDSEGCFYYSMELADPAGVAPEVNPQSYRPRTLQSLLEREGALPARECLEVFLMLTKVLAVLHGQGLIHRDLKPSNVLFVGGCLKLADIGLVTSVGQVDPVAGTPGYAPVEGADSVSSDLYSLGRMLYVMLTGNSCRRFPELPTDCLQESDPVLYRGLNDLILWACHPDPTRRPVSALQMRRELLKLSVRRDAVPGRPWWSTLFNWTVR